MSLRAAAVAFLLSGVAVSAVHAQSLADAARQEEARRKNVKPSGKVITNKDLPEVPPPTVVVPAPAAPGDTAAPSSADAPSAAAKDGADAKADGKADTDKKGDGKDEPKDQKYWSGRMKALREQLERDKSYSEALQSRINALTTDFVNRDNPEQRAVIATDRQKALAELDRLKKAIVDDTKAIADSEEEARRANVPAGWLR